MTSAFAVYAARNPSVLAFRCSGAPLAGFRVVADATCLCAGIYDFFATVKDVYVVATSSLVAVLDISDCTPLAGACVREGRCVARSCPVPSCCAAVSFTSRITNVVAAMPRTSSGAIFDVFTTTNTCVRRRYTCAALVTLCC